ncbi:CRS2-associated factor 1, chloroplastic [Linum grandiflorum]
MGLKLFQIPFPITAPPPSEAHLRHSTTVTRFSRWKNVNTRQFKDRKEIEDDSRRDHRFSSVDAKDQTTISRGGRSFKSVWTPSSPPGRGSQYSKPEGQKPAHPAFRQTSKVIKREQPIDRKADVKLSEDGLSYVIHGAPFEFKYSYTESPKVKPLKLREPPFSPFGPVTMVRPWTGRAPLPPSKKKLKEFDSFQPPPPNKKGVKPVQQPGPFLPGTGPRYVYTRDEILGEPLTKEEIKSLVEGCVKSRRQMNMGRDGLTHNMLDNIHAHWKRKRVCKIKCMGVCTVDLDNVCDELEQRTGGKIIYKKGGMLYLFRGRNYNYRTRIKLPLMLWKPAPAVYPRLVQKAPPGLTLDEASEMRKLGRSLIPICKLGKNGVYSNLADHVREAFAECELVRINCQGLNGGDFRRIGAKLRDLVPCVLISFEAEHILMWRGKDWKSSPTRSMTIDDQNETLSEEHAGITSRAAELSVPPKPALLDPRIDGCDNAEETHHRQPTDWKSLPCVQGVIGMLNKAVENGAAILLDDEELDADNIRKRTVSFSQSATPCPVFHYRRRRRKDDQESGDSEDEEVSATRVEGLELAGETVEGRLGVDELAKLLR